MSIKEIPVRNDFPAYSFSIDLDGVNYILSFKHNSRMDKWVMSIADSEGVAIVEGLAILTNVPLTQGLTIDRLPPGKFIAIDETGNNENPNEENFGTNVKLLYEEFNA